MHIDPEDFRRRYASLSDAALLGIRRDDLVDVARTAYDEEVSRRDLHPEPNTKEHAPEIQAEEADQVEELVQVGCFVFPDEAKLARALLESNAIPRYLANEHTLAANWNLTNALGGLRLMVPAGFAEQARDILESNISEADLAAQAEAAGNAEE